MQQRDEAVEQALIATAKNESKPSEERYAAIRHLCQLRGDTYVHAPLTDLSSVAAGMESFMGLKPLTMRDAAEAVGGGTARREQAATGHGHYRR